MKKVKARDELIRFAEEDTQQKFQNLSSVQQSHGLTRFYVKQIHNRTKTEISDDELDLAIVDGASDLGCDLIYRDDSHVLIVQSKYRSQTPARNRKTSLTFSQCSSVLSILTSRRTVRFSIRSPT